MPQTKHTPENKPLYKTTVTIYSAFPPVTLDGLVNEANRAEVNQYAALGNDAIIASEITEVLDVVAVAADTAMTDRVREYFQHIPAIAGPEGLPRVQAEVFRDGYAHPLTFDATAWFRAASIADLRDLIDCNFSREHAAEKVAWHFRGTHEALTALLNQCDDAGDIYEVFVNAQDALNWIQAHRPDPTLDRAIQEWADRG